MPVLATLSTRPISWLCHSGATLTQSFYLAASNNEVLVDGYLVSPDHLKHLCTGLNGIDILYSEGRSSKFRNVPNFPGSGRILATDIPQVEDYVGDSVPFISHRTSITPILGVHSTEKLSPATRYGNISDAGSHQRNNYVLSNNVLISKCRGQCSYHLIIVAR